MSLALALALVAPVLHHGGVNEPIPMDVCHSQACVVRVRTRAWREVVEPYRGWLARVRRCESNNHYNTNTGNGFYGAYQFTLQSWRAVGGWGMPDRARALHQDYRAVRLLQLQGRRAWPVCG